MPRHRDIDRGWAWVVLAAAYTSMLIYCIELYMAGVIYRELLQKFHQGEAKTSLVGALSSGLLCIAAPLGSVIINTFSCRVAMVTGAICSTTGFVLSAFVPSLEWMIVTAGVLVGIGFAVSSAGIVCVIGFYFDRWRDQVISVCFLVVGVAMFISAPFGLYLIEHHGLNGMFLIVAGIHAQKCVAGMLCKPSILEQKIHIEKKTVRKENKKSSSKSYMDLTLLKNKAFLCFLFSSSAWNFALTVAIMHLPNYVSVLGGTNKEIGLLMTAFAVANIAGRLAGALTVSKFNLKSLHVHVAVLALSSLITSIFPFYSKLPIGMYVFTVQLGVFCGWPNSMMTPISISFVGVAKLSEAYSLAYIFCGLGVITGPVLIGYVYGTFGSYEYSFVIAGVVLLLGSGAGLASLCLMKADSGEQQFEIYVVEDKLVLKEDEKLVLNDKEKIVLNEEETPFL